MENVAHFSYGLLPRTYTIMITVTVVQNITKEQNRSAWLINLCLQAFNLPLILAHLNDLCPTPILGCLQLVGTISWSKICVDTHIQLTSTLTFLSKIITYFTKHNTTQYNLPKSSHKNYSHQNALRTTNPTFTSTLEPSKQFLTAPHCH